MLFLQCVIVGLAVFLLMICIWERKVPKGVLEWVILVLSVVVLIDWMIKY